MKKLMMIFAATLIMSFAANQVHAAAYVKIGDIKGESMRKGHEEWIIIESYQHSNGVLIVKRKGGRKERLKDGTYKFKDGNQFLVKAGKAKLISGKGKRSIIRAKTKSVPVNKPGVERENIGVKAKKEKDDN